MLNFISFVVVVGVLLIILSSAESYYVRLQSIRRPTLRHATIEVIPEDVLDHRIRTAAANGKIPTAPSIVSERSKGIISSSYNRSRSSGGSDQIRVSKIDQTPVLLKGETRGPTFLENLSNMLEQESVSSFLPKDDLITMANEIRFNQVIMKKAYERFEVIWKYFREMVYEENRTLRDILGEEIYEKVLEIAGKLDVYDKQTVRSFIQTPAFVGMFGGIVYETIADAIGRVDWIGKRVNRIPVIGPIRQRVRKSIKNRLDRTVGRRFKKSVFNMVGEDSMLSLADFMVTQQNNKPFEDANRSIIETICNRPISSFFPETDETDEKLKKAIWSIVTDTPTSEFLPIMNYLYDKLGSARLSDIIALNFEPDLASQCNSLDQDGAKTIFSQEIQGTTVNLIIKLS